MIGQKNEKNTALLLFGPEKLEKYRSTELCDAPLEGSTIFLYRSSLGRKSLLISRLGGLNLDSSRLAELKYAIFSRTGSTIKKLRLSKLFLSMVFKHGLLEGSTFLFQYSFITHKKLGSSRLGELKDALLAEYYLRLKNESLQKGKK